MSLRIVGTFESGKLKGQECTLGRAANDNKSEIFDRAERLASQLDEKRGNPAFPYEYPEKIQVRNEKDEVLWDEEEREEAREV